MKKLFKALVIALIWLSSGTVSAHQPDISSFTIIESQPGLWMLQLNASMTAFQYEVVNAYGENSYSSPEEFNEMLVNYLKKQISIQVNGEEVMLEKGLVRLGHATTVAFELSGVPEQFDHVFVKNMGFENINKSQIIFSIIKEGMYEDHFILNEENDFQINLSLNEDQVLVADSNSNTIWMTLVAIVIITAVMGGFIYNKNMDKPSFQNASILPQS